MDCNIIGVIQSCHYFYAFIAVEKSILIRVAVQESNFR